MINQQQRLLVFDLLRRFLSGHHLHSSSQEKRFCSSFTRQQCRFERYSMLSNSFSAVDEWAAKCHKSLNSKGKIWIFPWNNVFAQECNGRSSCSWIVKIFPAQSKGRDASWLVLETTHHRNCWWAREESVEITKSKLGLPPERRIIKARNSDQKKLNGNTFKQRFTFENYSINKLKAGATLPSVNKTTKNQLNKTKQFPRSKTSQTGVPWTRLTAGQGSSLHLCDME